MSKKTTKIEIITKDRLTQEFAERFEDDLARFLAQYGLEGRIEDDTTGNTTVFPLAKDRAKKELLKRGFEKEYVEGLFDYRIEEEELDDLVEGLLAKEGDTIEVLEMDVEFQLCDKDYEPSMLMYLVIESDGYVSWLHNPDEVRGDTIIRVAPATAKGLKSCPKCGNLKLEEVEMGCDCQ